MILFAFFEGATNLGLDLIPIDVVMDELTDGMNGFLSTVGAEAFASTGASVPVFSAYPGDSPFPPFHGGGEPRSRGSGRVISQLARSKWPAIWSATAAWTCGS